ncbi:MAG: nucleotidyltransferase [Anaerovoracaceae bacterium]
MKVLGIIAEYNPIHNGHIYHIKESKKVSMADFVVVVMSGDFTQRGEAAIFDKWTRAKMAINAGADLVLEMPFTYACNSAEYFAKGGIGILNGLGAIESVSFGSESGKIDDLMKAADFFCYETDEYRENLKKHLDQGYSFPKARSLAAKQFSHILDSPNNILAIEYLKELKRLNSNIKPITIKRVGGGYNSEQLHSEFSSATAIRKSIINGEYEEITDYIPNDVYDYLIERGKIASSDNINHFNIIKSKLLLDIHNKDILKNVFGGGEGIENIIYKNIRNIQTLEELVYTLKSKRYTQTRINRFIIHSLVGFYKDNPMKLYTRVLALNSNGGKILKTIKKNDNIDLNIVDNVDKYNEEMLRYDIKASDFYNISFGYDCYKNCDYVKKPFIDKSY